MKNIEEGKILFIGGGIISTNNLDLIGHEKYEIRTILGIGL